MSSTNFIDLGSEDEMTESDDKERGLDSVSGTAKLRENNKIKKIGRKSKKHSSRQEFEDGRWPDACGVVEREPRILGKNCSPPSQGTAQICRQFWKAGYYSIEQSAKAPILSNGKNRLQVHPLFLHSNATSHKWAFGAIAELLDNAVDEIQNGATFVLIDKTINPRNGSPSLLIKDDGGGMDPEAIRRCMSFGFSDKKLKFGIGQYGNGFKTSSMRLGADVIVFTSHSKSRTLTQSVGLLSYTFLRQAGHDRIVVPLVDYEFDASSRQAKPILTYGSEHFSYNLSVLLQWSPYSTEETLQKQFDDIGNHGTKIIIYNLWLNSDGDLELDFNFDDEDIRINVDAKIIQTGERSKPVSDQHIANLYRYSLRVYASILYLRLPESFRIILCGRVVEHHNIANDLKFPEFILYRPQHDGNNEAQVITTIGFLKDAPAVNIHGFNIYHRNRLIMPFRRVTKDTTNNYPRGVVGILEVNFVEPTHNKQDFEKTSLFQKLEARLKEMAMEYWHLHCELIGYHQARKSPSILAISDKLPSSRVHNYVEEPVFLNHISPVSNNPRPNSAVGPSEGAQRAQQPFKPPGLKRKRKKQNHAVELELQGQSGSLSYATDIQPNQLGQASNHNEVHLQDEETSNLMQENQKLRTRLSNLERSEKHLNLKVQQLSSELGELESLYAKLLAELELTDKIKGEKYGHH